MGDRAVSFLMFFSFVSAVDSNPLMSPAEQSAVSSPFFLSQFDNRLKIDKTVRYCNLYNTNGL